MKLFDVHSHLQDKRLDNIRDDIILRANKTGVSKIVSCGVHQGDWEKLKTISDLYPSIIPAYGLNHP